MQSTPRTILDLFNGDVNYVVPHFQRFYVWERESQWLPLWEDISALAELNFENQTAQTTPHFMGAVVLKQQSTVTGDPVKRIIVDGQQRLTTIQIVITDVASSLKDIAINYTESNSDSVDKMLRIAKRIKDYTHNHSFQDDKKYKIHPFDKDFNVFRNIIDNDDTETSHLTIDCYNFFYSKSEAWLLNRNYKVSARAQALQKAIFEDIIICSIDLDKEEDEYVIFETLNARSEPLTEWEKAKNYFVSQSYNKNTPIGEADTVQTEFYRNHLEVFDKTDWWNTSESKTSINRIDQLFSYWLEICLSNKFDIKVPDRRSYHYFRNHLMSERDVEWAVNSLNRYAEIFQKFEMQDEDYSIQGRFAYRRRTLGVRVITPLMLRLCDIFGFSNQYDLCTRIVESYLFRRVVVGHDTRAYNKLFYLLLREINSCQDESIIPLKIVQILTQNNSLSYYWPNDSVIKSAVVDYPMYGYYAQYKLRIILQAINEYMTSPHAGAMPDYSFLEIEHIMPQKWKNHWSDCVVDEQQIEETIHKLGNLTIVNKKLNPRLSNKAWEIKKAEISSRDNLFINKELTTMEMWNEDLIHERGEKMAKIICKIWPHADAFEEEIG